MIVDEIGEVHQSIEDISRTASKFQRKHVVQFNFCKYIKVFALELKQQSTGCFPHNFAKF